MIVKDLQEKLSAHAFRTLCYAANRRNDFVCSLSGFESKVFRASLAELGALGYLEETPEPKPRYPYHVPQAPEAPLTPKGLKVRDVIARFHQAGVPLSEYVPKPMKLTKEVFDDIGSRWQGACRDESKTLWITNGYFIFRSSKKEWAQLGIKPDGSPTPRSVANIIKQPEKPTSLLPHRTDGTAVWLKAHNGFRDCRIALDIYRLVLHRYPQAAWLGGLYIPCGKSKQTWDYVYIFDKKKIVGVCTPLRD